jgi:hypothetical protein
MKPKVLEVRRVDLIDISIDQQCIKRNGKFENFGLKC